MAISKSKAAEILHDGRVHGKNLTGKQRRFMAWKAYGNKQSGGVIVDPNGYRTSNMENWESQMLIPSNMIDTSGIPFPIYANNQLLQPDSGMYMFPNTDMVLESPAINGSGLYRQGLPQRGMRWGGVKKRKRMQAGGLQNTSTPQGITNSTDSNVLLADLINYSVSQNANPLNTSYGRILRNSQLTPENQSLLSDLIIFNNRQDLQGRSPEQRLQTYYDLPSNNPAVQNIKNQLRPLGGGPVPFFRNSPDVNIQSLLAGMRQGGRMCLACGGKYRH